MSDAPLETRDLEVFVLMPAGGNDEYGGGIDESNYVFDEIICQGVEMAAREQPWRPKIHREVDRNRAGSITRALVNSLVKADVVIVDLTGKNANVFFELGIRYSLRDRITILMAHETTTIPFDIRGYRYIPYHPFRPQDARARLSEFVREALTDSTYSDSLVFETFSTLTVSIPNVFESRGQQARRDDSTMPWDEYMERIAFHKSYIKPAMDDNRFLPDALIGITNGGMVAADILGKAILPPSSIPVLTLWASRYAHTNKKSTNTYFENRYNEALTETLRDQRSDRSRILLVDDHLGTGLTSRGAIDFLASRLPDAQIVFVPIVSRRIEMVKDLVSDNFPYSFREFRVEESEFIEQVSTRYSYLPYLGKEINQSSSGSA